MDHSAGRLLDLLEDLKLEEDTLVIYFSDNGACLETAETKANYPGNKGPFRGGKGGTYEGGIRVPCVMRWKGRFPEGVVSNELAMHFDIFATVLEAVGLDVPGTNGRNPVHGISLIEHVLSGGAEPLPDRVVFWELVGKVAARKGRWKLVGEVESTRGRWGQLAERLKVAELQLYDLNEDIDESEDLMEKRPEEYLHLKNELIAFFENIK